MSDAPELTGVAACAVLLQWLVVCGAIVFVVRMVGHSREPWDAPEARR
ncbi:hypothetical protein [Ornithinimicrobium pratense]|nr:hypothetical protein [Ornithinimicrobium pratense]